MAPAFREALVPQSTVEATRALTALLEDQLQVLSTASNQPLLACTRVASPATSTSASHGEYFLPHDALLDFLPLSSSPVCPPPPSSAPPCVTPSTRHASTARHYTSKLSTLRDLVLY